LRTVYAWQHLANAGMIKGQYTGTPGPISYVDMRAGINLPAGRLPNSAFELYSFNTSEPGNWVLNPVFNQPYLLFGGTAGLGQDITLKLLTPGDSLTIDKKIDDGKPGTGNVTSTNSTFGDDYPACSNSDDINTAVYNVALNKATCVLLFKLDL